MFELEDQTDIFTSIFRFTGYSNMWCTGVLNLDDLNEIRVYYNILTLKNCTIYIFCSNNRVFSTNCDSFAYYKVLYHLLILVFDKCKLHAQRIFFLVD